MERLSGACAALQRSGYLTSDAYLSAFMFLLIMKGMFIVRYGNTQQMYIRALVELSKSRFHMFRGVRCMFNVLVGLRLGRTLSSRSTYTNTSRTPLVLATREFESYNRP
jgi:hypothetical protein